MFSFSLDSLPRLDGKRAVITGANSGLGLQTSWMLASRGAHVVMACRSPERAGAALETVRLRAPGAKVETATLDLAALASVRECAKMLVDGGTIDILVNNAGVMALPYRRTTDGFELQFGTNHLGHFALTGLVFEALATDARVVSIASGMHRAGSMHWDDLDGEKNYSPWPWYGQSKLANLLFAFGLGRRLQARGSQVKSVAAHPGYAATNLQHAGPKMEGSWLKSTMMSVGNALLAQSDERGAWPQVYASAAADAQSGQYWGPAVAEMWGAPKLSSTSSAARDENDQDRLWTISQVRTGVSFL